MTASIERLPDGKVLVKVWIKGEAKYARFVVDDWEEAEALAEVYGP